MKPWQVNIERALSKPDAPAAMNRVLLARIARSANGNEPVPPASLTRWVGEARRRDRLQAVIRGIYLNRFRVPHGQAADAVPYLRRDAVVSLNTVLADAGVLNNPSHVITAIMPFDSSTPKPTLGRLDTQAGTFHFLGLPRDVLDAGDAADRMPPDVAEHVRVTPEKALVDWLYLAASPYSHRTAPNLADMDLELLDMKRARRLAKAAGVDSLLRRWVEGKGL